MLFVFGESLKKEVVKKTELSEVENSLTHTVQRHNESPTLSLNVFPTHLSLSCKRRGINYLVNWRAAGLDITFLQSYKCALCLPVISQSLTTCFNSSLFFS